VKIGKIVMGLIAIALVSCVVRNSKAQTPGDEIESEIAAEDLRDAQAVCEKHRAELMKIPHVRVVTSEIDARQDAVILVEVDNPENADEVTRKLPPQIEGFPVEVGGNYAETLQSDFAVFEHGTPSPPPTIDKNGYYHHTWLKPSAPATKPDAQP
jgi:hypothetical protein